MDDAIKNKIKRATVTIINNQERDKKGRGFFVAGGLILTAAHCVPCRNDGEMSSDCYQFTVSITTADGETIRGKVAAVEPVSDIAVIGSTDWRMACDLVPAFNNLPQGTGGLVLCKDEFRLRKKISIHVLTHRDEWFSGHVEQLNKNAPTLFITTKPALQSGTSGSAIVDERGEVVGIVINSDECTTSTGRAIELEESHGTCPRPCQCLPVWLWQAIKAAELEAAN